jgi:hypothetical protein
MRVACCAVEEAVLIYKPKPCVLRASPITIVSPFTERTDMPTHEQKLLDMSGSAHSSPRPKPALPARRAGEALGGAANFQLDSIGFGDSASQLRQLKWDRRTQTCDFQPGSIRGHRRGSCLESRIEVGWKCAIDIAMRETAPIF